MAKPGVDRARVAFLLVEAAFYGDKATSEKHNISRTTLGRYRKRLNSDSELLDLVQHKRAEYEMNWTAELPRAIIAGIDFLVKAAQELEPSAENVHAIAGAMKVVAEIGLTKEMLDAKFGISRKAPEYRESMGQVESSRAIPPETSS